MLINRSLLLSITLLLINNQSNAMLRPTAQRGLKNVTSLHTRHMHSKIQQHYQHILKNKRYLLGSIAAAGGALYGIHLLKTEKEYQALISYHLATEEKYRSFRDKVLNAELSPFNFTGENGDTLLTAACRFGDIDTIKIFIDRYNIPIDDEPLGIAIYADHTYLVAFFLGHPNLKLKADNGLPKEERFGYRQYHSASHNLYRDYYNHNIKEHEQKQHMLHEQQCAAKKAKMDKQLDALISSKQK